MRTLTDTIRTRLDALSEAATPAPWDWWTDGEEVIVQEVSPEGGVIMCDANSVVKLPTDADVALIVALRNAYANGHLIPRDEVEGLIEALAELLVSPAREAAHVPVGWSKEQDSFMSSFPWVEDASAAKKALIKALASVNQNRLTTPDATDSGCAQTEESR